MLAVRRFRTLSVQLLEQGEGLMSKTARIEVRTDPEREALLKQAASLTNQTLTGFILDAAARRAERQAARHLMLTCVTRPGLVVAPTN